MPKPKNGGTNGERYTVEEVAAALRETKGLVFLTARKLGCCSETVIKYKRRYPVLAQIATEARGEMVDVAQAGLYKALLAGKGWAICFTLKTLGKDRGFVQRIEVADGLPPLFPVRTAPTPGLSLHEGRGSGSLLDEGGEAETPTGSDSSSSQVGAPDPSGD